METRPSHSSLQFWLARLEQAHPQTIELGLERVAQVRDTMGLHPLFPIILVGGTNGKGSTCAYLESILLAQGYKAGLYTSPHLLRYNERVRINAEDSSDVDIVAGLHAVEHARGATSLTYFEHGTLAAMWQFIHAAIDVAILEVGLGGRLDAVNCFDPAVSIVTTIDLDHQDWLGDTREKIGFEKAGIMRAGTPAICGDVQPPQSLLDHAAHIGATLRLYGQDFQAQPNQHAWDFAGQFGTLKALPMPGLPGQHQLNNAACALAALEALAETLPVSLQAIHAGLADARIQGRFQRIGQNPEIVLDVAHNPQGARALAQALRDYPVPGKTLAVFGMLADKDAQEVTQCLAHSFDAWFVTGLSGPRGQSAEPLQACVRVSTGQQAKAYPDPLAAWQAARLQAGLGDRIAVFGSFHTVAEILPHVCPRS